MRLKLVEELVKGEGLGLHALADTGCLDDLSNLAGLVEGVAGHDLPVVEHALREGLASSVGAEISGESYC
jgi:hypothetical protein